MPRRDALADVELVEADAPVAIDPRTPRRSRNRWWLLAAPVVVVVLGLGVQQVHDGLLRAADARVAALPGAVDPVGNEVLWQSDPELMALADGLVAHDALHAVIVHPDDGAVSYDAVDLATGDELWSTSLRGPDPAQTDLSTPNATTCASDAEPGTEPDRVVCLVTDGSAGAVSSQAPEPRPATDSHIVVLDLADGRVLADNPAPAVTMLAVLPGLAATAVVDAQHLVVVATDPLTGERALAVPGPRAGARRGAHDHVDRRDGRHGRPARRPWRPDPAVTHRGPRPRGPGRAGLGGDDEGLVRDGAGTAVRAGGPSGCCVPASRRSR